MHSQEVLFLKCRLRNWVLPRVWRLQQGTKYVMQTCWLLCCVKSDLNAVQWIFRYEAMSFSVFTEIVQEDWIV
jgi:hypothetical protein